MQLIVQRDTVHHGAEDMTTGRKVTGTVSRLAGHNASILRKQRKNRKWGQAMPL